jgi:hypothetical protein
MSDVLEINRKLMVQCNRIEAAQSIGQERNELAEITVDGLIDRLHRTEFPKQGTTEWYGVFNALSFTALRLDKLGCTKLAVSLCKAF